MLIDGKIGVEHIIRLADWDREAEPVASRRHSRCLNPVGFEVSVDSIDGGLTGLDVFLDLRIRKLE